MTAVKSVRVVQGQVNYSKKKDEQFTGDEAKTSEAIKKDKNKTKTVEGTHYVTLPLVFARRLSSNVGLYVAAISSSEKRLARLLAHQLGILFISSELCSSARNFASSLASSLVSKCHLLVPSAFITFLPRGMTL